MDGLDINRKVNKVRNMADKARNKADSSELYGFPVHVVCGKCDCVTVWFEGKGQNKEEVFGTFP